MTLVAVVSQTPVGINMVMTKVKSVCVNAFFFFAVFLATTQSLAQTQNNNSQVRLTSLSIDAGTLIRFHVDSQQLRPESLPILDQVSQVLADNPGVTIEIQVHTDERGAEIYNQRLSHDRALSIHSYLIGRGIDASRLSFRGYGEQCPIDRRHSPAAWAKNRRVIFYRTDTGVPFDCSRPSM